jgi:hypothetical protein
LDELDRLTAMPETLELRAKINDRLEALAQSLRQCQEEVKSG